MIPLMPSPGSPKMTSTPHDWIVSTKTSAAVIDMARSPRLLLGELGLDLPDRLQMILEHRQGLGHPLLEVPVLRLPAHLAERGHVLLVVLDHHLHVPAVEGRPGLARELIFFPLVRATRLSRELDALARGELRQLLARLAVVGDHSLRKLTASFDAFC